MAAPCHGVEMPSYWFQNRVHVVTGQWKEEVCDAKIPGPFPLEVRRTYVSMGPWSSALQGLALGWHWNHCRTSTITGGWWLSSDPVTGWPLAWPHQVANLWGNQHGNYGYAKGYAQGRERSGVTRYYRRLGTFFLEQHRRWDEGLSLYYREVDGGYTIEAAGEKQWYQAYFKAGHVRGENGFFLNYHTNKCALLLAVERLDTQLFYRYWLPKQQLVRKKKGVREWSEWTVYPFLSEIKQPGHPTLHIRYYGDFGSDWRAGRVYRWYTSSSDGKRPGYHVTYTKGCTTITTPLGAQHCYRYNDKKQMTHYLLRTDRGVEKEITYSWEGEKVVQITTSWGHTSRTEVLQYNADGELIRIERVWDGNRSTLCYRYDSRSRRIFEEKDGVQTTWVYRKHGGWIAQYVRIEGGITQRIFRTFDAWGQEIERQEDDGSSVEKENDAGVTYQTKIVRKSYQNGPFRGLIAQEQKTVYRRHAAEPLTHSLKKVYTYTPQRRIAAIHWFNGNTVVRWVTYAYTKQGWLKQEIHSNGLTIDKAYNKAGRCILYNDGSKKIFARYNAWGEKVYEASVLAWGTRRRIYRYNQHGQRIEKIAQGCTTRYSYDQRGRCVERSISGLQNSTETWHYSTSNRTILRKKTGRHPSIVQKDAMGRAVVQSQGGVVTRRRYSKQGWLLEEAQDGGLCIRTEYDLLGRPLKQTTSGTGWRHRTVVWSYQKGVITKCYDDGRRDILWMAGSDVVVEKQEDPVTETARWVWRTFDSSGRLCAVTKGDTTCRRTWHYQFDPFGKKIGEKVWRNGVAHTFRYQYDAWGNCTKKIEVEKERVWRYLYQNGALIEEHKPEGSVRRYCYSTDGVVGHQRARSCSKRQIVTTFDALDRCIKRVVFSPQRQKVQEIHYCYDSLDRIVERKEAHLVQGQCSGWCVTTNTYDLGGRLASKVMKSDTASVAWAWEYNVFGQLQRAITPRGILQYQWWDGALTCVKGEDGVHLVYTYDAMGNACTSTNVTDQITAHRRYNRWSELCEEKNERGEVIYKRYNALGECSHSTTPYGSVTRQRKQAMVEVHSPYGKRKSAVDVKKPYVIWGFSGVDYHPKVDALKRVVEDHTGEKFAYNGSGFRYRKAVAQVPPTYDLNGCAVRWSKDHYLLQYYHDQEWQLTYDSLGRLIEAHSPSVTKRWIYDAWHRPVTILRNGEATHMSYDETRSIAIHRKGRTVWRLCDCSAYEMGTTLWLGDGKKRVEAQHDALGSLCGVYDGEKEIAFPPLNGRGSVCAHSGDIHWSLWRFQGMLYDEDLGLYLGGRRFYSPHTGSWIQPDPIHEAQGAWRVSYALHNHYRYHERWGLACVALDAGTSLDRYHYLHHGRMLESGIIEELLNLNTHLGRGKSEDFSAIGIYHHTHPKRSVLFVNGIRTDFRTFLHSVRSISHNLQADVVGVYNPRHSLLADCWRGLQGFFRPTTHEAVDHQILRGIRLMQGNNPNKPLYLIGHSHGFARISQVVHALSLQEKSRMHLIGLGGGGGIGCGDVASCHNFVSEGDALIQYGYGMQTLFSQFRSTKMSITDASTACPWKEHALLGGTYQNYLEKIRWRMEFNYCTDSCRW